MNPKVSGAFAGIDVDVVFLQLAAEGAARDAELLGRLAAMTAAALQSANNHLLFHAVEIADGHGCGLPLSDRVPRHRGRDLRCLGSRGSLDSTATRAIRLRSSRTLPGQECESKAEIASGANELRGVLEAEKVLRQGDDVFGPLAQWRHAQLKLAETVEKILAKAAGLDGGVEILISGGDDADINLDFAVAAQAVEGISIQHAQELYLSLQLQFADFVEKQRALVSQFEQAGLGRIRASESALFIAE